MARFWMSFLAMLVCCAAASRLDTSMSIKDMMMSFKDLGRGGGGRDQTAYMKIKFRVPPSEQEKFIQAWRRLEDEVKNDKDIRVIKFDLEKYITDNIYFTGYSEFESFDDLMTHFNKRYADDFQKFTADHEITWQLMPLKNLSGRNEKGKAYRRNDVDRRRKQEDLTHMVFTYYVPPMHHEMFLDAWERKAEDTLNEDGNHIYALRKLATDNEVFFSYGTWETNDDFRHHLNSKHSQRFHDCIYKKDITYFMTPLTKLGRNEL